MSDPREINRRISECYDLRPWEQGYPDRLDPPALQSVAREYGADRHIEDVLDLGCGSGDILVRAGERTTGRLVGADISSTSCARATEKLARFDGRAEIINADLFDLQPQRLGQFDLIYCTGVIFVAPPEVRERIIELIGRCLRPGGTVLISYYAGLAPAVRAHLGKSMRSIGAATADPRKSRELLNQLRPGLRRPSHFTLALRAAFAHFDRLDDDFLFAEMLNGAFESISTAELNQELERYGIEFATYVGFSGFKPAYRAVDRAIMADRFDVTDGAFRYALFVKPLSDRHANETPGPEAYPVAAFGPKPLRRRLRRALRHLFWLIFRV